MDRPTRLSPDAYTFLASLVSEEELKTLTRKEAGDYWLVPQAIDHLYGD